MVKISNNILAIEVSPKGAELSSILKGGQEYLWQADPKFWPRHSPVLFPIVGRLWDNKYRIKGEEHQLSQHGFARDMEFTLLEQSEDYVRFQLESTPETLEKYPFEFRLIIGYSLNENRVGVHWSVENIGSVDFPFQIGAHPAFYYPNFDEKSEKRCYLDFCTKEQLHYIKPVEKGCTTPDQYPLVSDNGVRPIDIHSFDECATYVFENHQVNKVSILDLDKKPYVSVEFDMPILAVWSPVIEHPDVPFICLEPWCGRCDSVGFDGDLYEREAQQILAPGEIFRNSYYIIVE